MQTLDRGVPQILEPPSLRKVLLVDSGAAGAPGPVTERQAGAQPSSVRVITRDLTSATPWRPHGIRHSKPNEVHIDVVERVSVILSSSGQLLSGEVHGVTRLNCRLSGMPTLSLGLNDALPLVGAVFHPSVRLERFAQSGEILCVPPEGVFDLVKWHVTDNITPPIKASNDGACAAGMTECDDPLSRVHR